jgi:hypothetical protein
MFEQDLGRIAIISFLVWVILIRPLSVRHLRSKLAIETGHASELLVRLSKRNPNSADYLRWSKNGDPSELYNKTIMKYRLFGFSLRTKLHQLRRLTRLFVRISQIDTYYDVFGGSPVSDKRKINEMNKLHEEHKKISEEIDHLITQF